MRTFDHGRRKRRTASAVAILPSIHLTTTTRSSSLAAEADRRKDGQDGQGHQEQIGGWEEEEGQLGRTANFGNELKVRILLTVAPSSSHRSRYTVLVTQSSSHCLNPPPQFHCRRGRSHLPPDRPLPPPPFLPHLRLSRPLPPLPILPDIPLVPAHC